MQVIRLIVLLSFVGMIAAAVGMAINGSRAARVLVLFLSLILIVLVYGATKG